MSINATPPWAHPQRADPSLPFYTRGSIGYTPYIGMSKIFWPKQDSQEVVMFVGGKERHPCQYSKSFWVSTTSFQLCRHDD